MCSRWRGRSTAASAPAFYGLRTTHRGPAADGSAAHQASRGAQGASPDDLGRVLGLDRAPRSRPCDASSGAWPPSARATEFGRALAQRRVASRGAAMGFLYVDGHVRVYHGKHTIPKAHVARMRISMPATTDYWVERRGRRPAVRGDRRGQRRPGQDAPQDPRRDPAARRRAPGHGRLRPRRLEPEAVSQAHRRRLRHPHLPQGAAAAAWPSATSQTYAADRRPRGSATCSPTRTIRLQLPDGTRLALRQVTRLGRQRTTPDPDPHLAPRPLRTRGRLPHVRVAGDRRTSSSTCARSTPSTPWSSYDVEPDDPLREVPNPARRDIDNQAPASSGRTRRD